MGRTRPTCSVFGPSGVEALAGATDHHPPERGHDSWTDTYKVGAGGLFAAWVQDGSLMVFTSASFDRTMAEHFLRDYLGTPPAIPVTE